MNASLWMDFHFVRRVAQNLPEHVEHVEGTSHQLTGVCLSGGHGGCNGSVFPYTHGTSDGCSEVNYV